MCFPHKEEGTVAYSESSCATNHCLGLKWLILQETLGPTPSYGAMAWREKWAGISASNNDISTKQICPFFPMAPLKLPGKAPDPDGLRKRLVASWCAYFWSGIIAGRAFCGENLVCLLMQLPNLTMFSNLNWLTIKSPSEMIGKAISTPSENDCTRKDVVFHRLKHTQTTSGVNEIRGFLSKSPTWNVTWKTAAQCTR